MTDTNIGAPIDASQLPTLPRMIATSLGRAALGSLGTVLMAHGYLTPSQGAAFPEQALGAVLWIATAIWVVVHNSKSHATTQAALLSPPPK